MNSFKTWVFYPHFTGRIYNKIKKISLNYYNRYSNSISRTKNKIFEYCYCNDFDYFVTLTINPSKYDRFNLSKYYKDFSQFIRDYRKKYNIDIQYLFVPELHKDGSWHMHGLIKGIPLNHLTINCNGFLDWEAYRNKFGFISLDKIQNKEACSIYMTKYITKDFFKNIKLNKGNKLYYCSRGLKTSEIIFKGNINGEILFEPNFCSKYLNIYDIHI